MIRLVNKKNFNKIRFDRIPNGTIFGFHNAVLIKVSNCESDGRNRNCVILSIDYESDDKFIAFDSLCCGELVYFTSDVEIEYKNICLPWSKDVEIRF